VLSKIQEVQPEDPLEFMCANLAVSLKYKDVIRDMESKLATATQEISRLQKENERLKRNERTRSNSK
jgi:hypothetical protein